MYSHFVPEADQEAADDLGPDSTTWHMWIKSRSEAPKLQVLMVQVPGWDDEIRPALQALVDDVGEQYRHMITATDYPEVRQLAAAKLSACGA